MMKIVKTFIAIAFISFFSSCAKEEIVELEQHIETTSIQENDEILGRKAIEPTLSVVEITTDVIRPRFTTEDGN